MTTLETPMEWLSDGRNKLQQVRREIESSLNLLVRTELNHLLILLINFSVSVTHLKYFTNLCKSLSWNRVSSLILS